MSAAAVTSWTNHRIDASLRAVDRRARLVRPRVLARVIRGAEGEHAGFRVAHAESYVVPAREALAHVNAEELRIAPDHSGDLLILLAEPDDAWLQNATDAQVLLWIWRRLAHAQVHVALRSVGAGVPLGDEAIQQRIARIGAVEFAEIVNVLRDDHRLFNDHDARVAYTEFVATYVELREFAPSSLPDMFPGLRDMCAVDRLIEADIDVRSIVNASRPDGAPAPSDERGDETEMSEPAPLHPKASPVPRSTVASRALQSVAARMRARGNDVRVAILQTACARRETPSRAGECALAAGEALDRLSDRLARALSSDEATREQWRNALGSLAPLSVDGFRTAAARVLYELQLVCIAHERPVYQINLADWVLSLGRRSIQRALPHQSEVRTVAHLRRALTLMRRVPLDGEPRRRVVRLLLETLDDAEQKLRATLKPVLARALQRAGFAPANVPEGVALETITEELLDRVEQRGHFTIADARDAVARNDLKMDDLKLSEFVHGDLLLQADRRLSVALPGIYRRAEIYLRGLQKASSIAFASSLGRIVTLFIVLPFGGALATLVTLEHLVEMAQRYLPQSTPIDALKRELSVATLGASTVAPADRIDEYLREHLMHETHVNWMTPANVFGLGLLILALMHWPLFRAVVVRCLRGVWWGIRGLFWDFPRAIAALPPVKAVLNSKWLAVTARWLLWPAFVAALASIVAVPGGSLAIGATFVVVYALTVTTLTTRWGALLLDEVAASCGRAWTRVRYNLLPGLYRAIMDFFHAVLEQIDQMLYTVDEWLRFRTGESRWTLALKAVGGALWSAIAYVVRLFVNLLAEPQINPIKHFPTVTVAHKMTAPFLLLALPALLEGAPFGMSAVNANLIAVVAQMLLPGVFGFLVWELKENWRLYRANRPKTLRPLVVGSHGETVARFLRPGLHSGTLPRAFARLRRAHREGNAQDRHKPRETIAHVVHDTERFVERQLLALLRASHGLADLELSVGHVTVATNQIVVPVENRAAPSEPLTIRYGERKGWLEVAVDRVPGWVRTIPANQRVALENALAGLYHRSGVDLIREQAIVELAPVAENYELSESGIRAWPEGSAHSVHINLRDGSMMAEAREAAGTPEIPGTPTLVAERLLLKQNSVSWSTWVDIWERERALEPVPALLGFPLLESDSRAARHVAPVDAS